MTVEREHPQRDAHQETSHDKIQQRDDAGMRASDGLGSSGEFNPDGARSMENDGHSGIVFPADSRASVRC